MNDQQEEFCKYFYYDENYRLPCHKECRYYEEGSFKCLSLGFARCIYTNCREPIDPSIILGDIDWCPGPGGCKHFNMDDYSCNLQRTVRTFELKTKHWDFAFGGKAIMIIGAILFVSSLVYALGHRSTLFISQLFIMFGVLVVTAGYLFWLWENKQVGSSIFGDVKEKEKDREAQNKDSVLHDQEDMKPLPIMRNVDTDVFEGDDCTNYYYDAKRRITCKPECKLWSSSKGKCSKPYLSPNCSYPLQRKPIAPLLMPKPVGWCPGPGGCEYFDNSDYSCILKTKGETVEYRYIFEATNKRNRIRGMVLTGVGSLSAVLFMCFVGLTEKPYAVIAVTLFCIMIAMIGRVIWRWSK
ncbi:hypothetical protein K9N50_09025 [bacterium]|nr:hypothetical protein [bacterium]